MQQLTDFVWVENYRPRPVAETILPADLKAQFQQFVDNGDCPNLILDGSAGVGKTTIAKAMLTQMGVDYIVVDGSMDGNIDTLRTTITNFASTVSFTGGRKFVIIDEADNMNPTSFQPALRGFMERFSKNCGFILTCNSINRIIEPLWSRASIIHFVVPKEERQTIATDFFKRVVYILDKEEIVYNKSAVAGLVKKHFPDFRRVLNELQSYAANGTIDAGILVDHVGPIERLIEMLKDKDFTRSRKWVAENVDMQAHTFFRALYDQLPNHISSTTSIAEMILVLAEYQEKEAFVADSEINRVAALVDVMKVSQWKK